MMRTEQRYIVTLVWIFDAMDYTREFNNNKRRGGTCGRCTTPPKTPEVEPPDLLQTKNFPALDQMHLE